MRVEEIALDQIEASTYNPRVQLKPGMREYAPRDRFGALRVAAPC